MTMTLIAKPSAGAITLDDAKEHLRVSHDDEDDVIEALVDAATGWLDGMDGVLGRALEAQTWEWALDQFPRGAMKLPLGPAASITSIKYTDRAGIEQIMDPGDYVLNGGFVTADAWPDGSAIKVRYVAGTGTPDTIKVVAKLLVGHWYENREAVGERMESLPLAVDMLIAPLRRVRL